MNCKHCQLPIILDDGTPTGYTHESEYYTCAFALVNAKSPIETSEKLLRQASEMFDIINTVATPEE
jgi:hypothetical protein